MKKWVLVFSVLGMAAGAQFLSGTARANSSSKLPSWRQDHNSCQREWVRINKEYNRISSLDQSQRNSDSSALERKWQPYIPALTTMAYDLARTYQNSKSQADFDLALSELGKKHIWTRCQAGHSWKAEGDQIYYKGDSAPNCRHNCFMDARGLEYHKESAVPALRDEAVVADGPAFSCSSYGIEQTPQESATIEVLRDRCVESSNTGCRLIYRNWGIDRLHPTDAFYPINGKYSAGVKKDDTFRLCYRPTSGEEKACVTIVGKDSWEGRRSFAALISGDQLSEESTGSWLRSSLGFGRQPPEVSLDEYLLQEMPAFCFKFDLQ